MRRELRRGQLLHHGYPTGRDPADFSLWDYSNSCFDVEQPGVVRLDTRSHCNTASDRNLLHVDGTTMHISTKAGTCLAEADGAVVQQACVASMNQQWNFIGNRYLENEGTKRCFNTDVPASEVRMSDCTASADATHVSLRPRSEYSRPPGLRAKFALSAS